MMSNSLGGVSRFWVVGRFTNPTVIPKGDEEEEEDEEDAPPDSFHALFYASAVHEVAFLIRIKAVTRNCFLHQWLVFVLYDYS